MGFSSIAIELQGQLLTPNITITGSRSSTFAVTTSEALANLHFESMRASEAAVWATKTHYPKDSLRQLDRGRAAAWVGALPETKIQGIHLDAYGTIAAMAHANVLAQQKIQARLASPGLSTVDRAYTLQMAVQTFAEEEIPARLAIAERYLVQLDALGAEAALYQFRARESLVYAYYQLGRGADVARHGVRALELVTRMPYEQRGVLYGLEAAVFLYGATVDALSGQPNGRATLRKLNTQLAAGVNPPSELLARGDSSFLVTAKYTWTPEIERKIAMSARVGEAGTPLIANYWINRGVTRDSQRVAVTDGRIRVIEIGSFTCGPCIAAVSGLERLHQRYAGVEFNFMTATEGVWGNRMIAANDEADSLAKHFLEQKHITFPIGIALRPRIATKDGGAEIVESTPTWHADQYPQISKPTFYILDGHGVIRRVLAGYNRDLEDNIASIVEFLQNDASQSAAVNAVRTPVLVSPPAS